MQHRGKNCKSIFAKNLKGGIILSFDSVKAWIITICFVIISLSSVYTAIKVADIVDRLETIAEFIGNIASR
jgi:hypothetical protein